MSSETTILIAEPAETLASQLAPFLAGKGYSVARANSLRHTLLTIQRQRTDVLVLDAALLGEECEFISIIKGIEEDLPIIICAERNTPEFESEVRRQRIFYYHIQSFGTRDLELAVVNAINKQSN